MSKAKQFIKDKLISKFIRLIQRRQNRLFTPMQMAVLYLKTRGFLPKKIKALELFGMHGLWHTKDYIDLVESLDIFELDSIYHKQSKEVLHDYNVSFYNEDSIKWLSKTNNKYELVISDSPAMEMFYGKDGLPYFFSDLIKVCEPNGVIIFNTMIPLLPVQEELNSYISSKCENRIVKNLAFYPRSEKIMYIVLVLD